MKYIVIKRFKEKCMCGEVNIPYGTEVNCENNIIFFNNKPLCYNSSQQAYDYFARNDDNKGLERGKLIKNIKKTLEKKDNNHQNRWNKIWEKENVLKNFKKSEFSDYWLWNFNFYNADIKDLNYIYNLIKEEK